MRRKLIYWNIQLTILTKFSSLSTYIFMFIKLSNSKLFLTKLASFFFMKLFFMLFLRVNIVHFATLSTSFDIPSTIAKMSSYFLLREFF